ncbi:putative soluble lytic murein transglycosylase [Alteripontixanthobacter maritimus]|uniref:Putative soluble lytic murein transglycosylase n=1 Tax=Alteripontixanthobacter maritimus TaxID=2161824 RepID=A0A369Q9J3_9SPHN|nr:lytic transglycosylase domain-containing protein [Alteripontixanthobacter maritimus]RDC60225.1 putative soluble lytic murein transglycosylase [Alteripontixanthobacter maritimus]
MSSMARKHLTFIALLTTPIMTASAQAQPAWNQARADLVASQPNRTAQVVDTWQLLVDNQNLGFDRYAGFLVAYPGFPQEDRLRTRAEGALDSEPVSPERVVAYFDTHPPLTNSGRARYALALAAMGRAEAAKVALEAWRGGEMSSPSEAYLVSQFGSRFGPEDHDARIDALLWQGEVEAAARQIANVSPAYRDVAMARLAMLQGNAPSMTLPASARSDPGYVYNTARYYRMQRQLPQAINLLSSRPAFTGLPLDPEAFVTEMLRVARGADARSAQRIAAKVDDLFAPNTDISREAYKLRDDYTSLMWLGGTKASWELGDHATAAPLFYRYGAAAQTPQTRSKGFYWAGLASERAGNRAEADRYYRMAGEYSDRFYGMLALEKLGSEVPFPGARNAQQPSPEQVTAFNAAPLTEAVRHVARGAPWRTGIQFYRTIAQNADTQAEHMLTTELARQTGRRDLSVNVAEAAGADGFNQFVAQGFPTMDTPPGSNWTMIHAISRQESQFAENAISHAGARGLMQLMPGTAREQAGKLGMNYMQSRLIDDPVYNVQLGNGYFARMMDYYGGAYPLAIAAYNAGPGNVNKWLRRNGDPRKGSIDWVTWIERIPIFETKNYVQRVIENAAVYEQLNPDRAPGGRGRVAGDFLR